MCSLFFFFYSPSAIGVKFEGETDSEIRRRLSVQTFISIQTAAGSDSIPQHSTLQSGRDGVKREREGGRERNPPARRVT